ncbi:hypothetical protein J6590_059115 [Homalodisca vitripennis]|nr:hypothetical protein J6590_059115 [Homalodisca vitripennis]
MVESVEVKGQSSPPQLCHVAASSQEELRRSCPIKDEVRRTVSTPLELGNNWTLYYPPHAIPQPTALYKQHPSHYHSSPSHLTLPIHRYHPYQMLRGIDTFGYPMSIHDIPPGLKRDFCSLTTASQHMVESPIHKTNRTPSPALIIGLSNVQNEFFRFMALV